MLEQKSNFDSSNLERSEQINVKELKQLLNAEKSLPKLVSSTGESIPLSKYVNDTLYQILEAAEAGIEVIVSPVDRDMTIAEAAEVLNVSSEYLEKLLDREEISFKIVGTSRHINTKEILDYKSRRDANRRKGLAELTAFMQETGGYAD